METEKLQYTLEAIIFAAHAPMPISQLALLFDEKERPSNASIKEALMAIQDAYEGRGVELRELGSGYQFQSRVEYAPWVKKLWEDRAPRYSRALLETLVLIAYRQPITRAEIEAVRGVAVSTNIVKTLLEREWVRVVGQREVPGRPSLYGTTKRFLDYFNLTNLSDLPTLDEIHDLDKAEEKLTEQLDLAIGEGEPDDQAAEAAVSEGVISETEAPADEYQEVSIMLVDEDEMVEVREDGKEEIFQLEEEIETEGEADSECQIP